MLYMNAHNLAYYLGKGHQQARILQGADVIIYRESDILQDADAARGACALQSSSL
jgi:hypothetical protein